MNEGELDDPFQENRQSFCLGGLYGLQNYRDGSISHGKLIICIAHSREFTRRLHFSANLTQRTGVKIMFLEGVSHGHRLFDAG